MQEIKFNHVTFKYPDSNEVLIDNQSFVLPTNNGSQLLVIMEVGRVRLFVFLMAFFNQVREKF